jgi:hypothetical protein
MSEKLTKAMNNTTDGDWRYGEVSDTRFEITGGKNGDKTIAFVFNEYDAEFIEICRMEVPKLLAEIERLKVNTIPKEFGTGELLARIVELEEENERLHNAIRKGGNANERK